MACAAARQHSATTNVVLNIVKASLSNPSSGETVQCRLRCNGRSLSGSDVIKY